MKPAVIVLVLCLIASVLFAIHQMACEQKEDTTTSCDMWFGVPIIVLCAVACGISGLAVLAMNEVSTNGGKS